MSKYMDIQLKVYVQYKNMFLSPLLLKCGLVSLSSIFRYCTQRQ